MLRQSNSGDDTIIVGLKPMPKVVPRANQRARGFTVPDECDDLVGETDQWEHSNLALTKIQDREALKHVRSKPVIVIKKKQKKPRIPDNARQLAEPVRWKDFC